METLSPDFGQKRSTDYAKILTIVNTIILILLIFYLFFGKSEKAPPTVEKPPPPKEEPIIEQAKELSKDFPTN